MTRNSWFFLPAILGMLGACGNADAAQKVVERVGPLDRVLVFDVYKLVTPEGVVKYQRLLDPANHAVCYVVLSYVHGSVSGYAAGSTYGLPPAISCLREASR